jgi:hypothetical protein
VKPLRIEFAVGETVHGQDVRLTRETVAGRISWTLVQHALNQRDDTITMRGLTDDVLLAIADAVREFRTGA